MRVSDITTRQVGQTLEAYSNSVKILSERALLNSERVSQVKLQLKAVLQ